MNKRSKEVYWGIPRSDFVSHSNGIRTPSDDSAFAAGLVVAFPPALMMSMAETVALLPATMTFLLSAGFCLQL